VRTATSLVAAIILTAALPAWAAEETIVMEDGAGIGMPADPAACGCRNQHAPPWHGNVAGDPCGPSCPPPNTFHANPCDQLWMKHHAHQRGYLPPSWFPRLEGRMTHGSWPTPRPIQLPRCPNCGAHIDLGM